MKKRALGILLIGSAVALCVCAPGVQAEDGHDIALTIVNGHRYLTNQIPDAPVALPEPVPVPVKAQEPVPAPGQMPAEYRSIVDVKSKENGVDPELIAAVMKTESNFNRWAVSSKGAKGLMQLMPETGKRFGVQDFFDPRQNIDGGVRYLKFLLNMFHGNIDLSLAAYNAGENLVARIGGIPEISETKNYVKSIRGVYKTPNPDGRIALTSVPPPVQAVTSPAEDKPEDAPNKIYMWVDARGRTNFSTSEPPN